MGFMPYVSYHGGDIDNVNLANGNLFVHTPFLSYPQRGNVLRVALDLMYNGKPYQVQNFCAAGRCTWLWLPSGFSQGWGGHLPSPPFGVNIVDADAVTVPYEAAKIPNTNPTDYGDLFKIMTADNASHLLGLVAGTGGSCGTGSTGYYYSDWGTFETLDATGWQMLIPSCGSGTTAVVSPTGVRHEGQDTLRVDPNGNYLTITLGCPPSGSCIEIPTSITDTLGRQIPLPAAAGAASTSLCPSGPATVVSAAYWTPPGYNGTTLQYLLCYASVPINIPPVGSAIGLTASLNVLQSIVLPNNTSWTFAYNDSSGTYNGNPTSYGSLTQITFPTGGTISYTYISYGNVTDLNSRWVSSRTVNANDGTGPHTWNYAYGYTGSGQQTYAQTIVTDPLGNDTAHTFGLGVGTYETLTQYYQGSHTSGTLLKTVATNYEYFSNLNSSTPDLTGVVPIQDTTTWAADNEVSQTNNSYDLGFTYVAWTTGLGQGTSLYGKVTSETDYDYGIGAHGNALRTTNTSYAWQSPNPNYSSYLTNNLLILPYSVQIQDGGGTQRAYTYYGYDETSLQSSGIAEQKISGESYPGNQTSVHRWLNGSTTGTTLCNAVTNGYLLSTKAYYDTGEVPTSTDPCGHQTKYQYSSSYYGAFVTTATNALNQNTIYGYDFNTGVVTSITDSNSQITTKNYDILARPTSVSYPDGGSTTDCYTDMGGATCTQSGAPYQVVVTKAITSSLNKTSTVVFDGLGRVSQTQLNSDTPSTTYTLTTYDALGRKSQVYNPTRCSPITTNCGETTWGYTTTNYDPLSRVTSVVEQDTSAVSTNYASFPCTTVTDEAGKARKSCVDGLGRMTGVWEDPSGLNYETDYGYDALGNLTSVDQKGSNVANARARGFVFDSLSELTSSTNPESGQISYGYDADGNVITKTAPLPNQTGTSTVTTTSTYDVLNRLIQKSYKDGTTTDPYTPTVQFGYDAVAPTGCTTTPPSAPDSYPVGRRTAMCDGSGAASYTHDKMGRILRERRTIGAVLGDYENDSYNLDGSPATFTTLGYQVTYTYTGAGRPITASNYTGGTTNFVKSATYAPPGELTAMTLGSTSSFAGIVTNNAYNDRLQPILLSATVAGQNPVFSLCFDFHLAVAVTTPSPCSFSASTLGDNGNAYQVVNNRDNTRSETLMYDSLNRISSGQSNGTQWGETFTIDAWSNLTNETPISGKTNHEGLNTSAGTNNQLAGFGYDAAGNMTSNGSASYVYDAENRLIATAGTSYIYDGNGQRVEKCTEGTTPGTCASGSTGTLYWRGQISDALSETDLAGNIQNTYIFFNGQRVARRDSAAAIHYYFSDHLGSHGVVENATGTTCEQDIDYYPYGGVEHDYCPNAVQNYKFTGKERDMESGLDYFGKRFHASSLGRFMSVDPHDILADAKKPDKVRTELLDPQSWNRYAYVTNNPLKYADWEGLEKILVVYVQQPVPGTSKTYQQKGLDTITGHAFIGLKDTTAHTETKAGFYPKSGVIPEISTTTTGEVRDDSNHSWNVKQEYKITDDQYNAVQQSISNDKGDTNLQYDLDTNNCTDWVMDTAAIAGVTLPDATGTWPGGGGESPGPLGQEVAAQPGATVQQPKKDGGSSGSSDDSSGSSI